MNPKIASTRLSTCWKGKCSVAAARVKLEGMTNFVFAEHSTIKAFNRGGCKRIEGTHASRHLGHRSDRMITQADKRLDCRPPAACRLGPLRRPSLYRRFSR